MREKKQNKTEIVKIIKKLSREEFNLKSSSVIKSKKTYKRKPKHKKEPKEE
ncbi:MAG: hypothetical protein OEZ13_03775 [Spirochaetia bacterium]|nr:hypothetical protein [Spirochaetia bacterium]